jgi:hypothetical protein
MKALSPPFNHPNHRLIELSQEDPSYTSNKAVWNLSTAKTDGHALMPVVTLSVKRTNSTTPAQPGNLQSLHLP